jgi:hypothetical protein
MRRHCTLQVYGGDRAITDHGLDWYPTSQTAPPTSHLVLGKFCFCAPTDLQDSLRRMTGTMLTTTRRPTWIAKISTSPSSSTCCCGTVRRGTWRATRTEQRASKRCRSVNEITPACTRRRPRGVDTRASPDVRLRVHPPSLADEWGSRIARATVAKRLNNRPPPARRTLARKLRSGLCSTPRRNRRRTPVCAH